MPIFQPEKLRPLLSNIRQLIGIVEINAVGFPFTGATHLIEEIAKVITELELPVPIDFETLVALEVGEFQLEHDEWPFLAEVEGDEPFHCTSIEVMWPYGDHRWAYPLLQNPRTEGWKQYEGMFFERARTNSLQALQAWRIVLDEWIANPSTASVQCPSFRHSIDFRSVVYQGLPYYFSANEAAVAAELYQAWINGTPDVGDEAVLLKCNIHSRQLLQVFRNNAAWNVMIVQGSTKGTHRIAGLTPVLRK